MDGSTLLTLVITASSLLGIGIGTLILSRTRGRSSFVDDMNKQLEFYRGIYHEQAKTIAIKDAEIETLNSDCRDLGKENMQLLRDIARMQREGKL